MVCSLADSLAVREGLNKPPTESGIQALAEAVNQNNGFLFIEVTNMQGIRYSHPEEQRIGQPFKSGDILLSLQGNENIAIGALNSPLHDVHSYKSEDGSIYLTEFITRVNKNVI